MNLILIKNLKTMIRISKLSILIVLCSFHCLLITSCGSVDSGPTVTDDSNNDSNNNNNNNTNSIQVANQNFSTKANQELQINLNTLLTQFNASKKYTYSVVTPPTKGLVAIQNNILTYSPSQTGTDEIQFQVSEGSNKSNVGKITISVDTSTTSTQQQPLVLVNKTVTTVENEEVIIDVSSMIKNFDSNTTYNFILETTPNRGAVKINGLSLIYTPIQNQTGDDIITLRAGDGESTSNLATINITIQDLSTSAPKLQSVTYTIKPNVPANLDLNLLFLPPHPFSDKTYTFTILQQGKLGSGEITNRSLTYTPILNAFGTDSSLRVLVTDQLGQKAEATLVIIISLN